MVKPELSSPIDSSVTFIFIVTEVSTGSPGKYIGRSKTIRGFQLIFCEELDGLPEYTFYLVGNIDKITAKAMNIKIESKLKK